MLENIYYFKLKVQKDKENERQAGAELCQAQVKLRVIVFIGVKV